MSAFDDYSWSGDDFSGTARLFPLPNLVLFPHVMQPLHIFEPRYCDLLEEALADDRLIAMATLTEGWEGDYEGRPPVYPIACLGCVAACHSPEGNSHNVLLVGLKRIRLLGELPTRKKFREANVEVCEDHFPTVEVTVRHRLQQQFSEAVLRILPNLPQAQEQLRQLLGSDVPLETLTDVIGYMLDISIAEKMALLAELDVHRRAAVLLDYLSAAASDTSPGRCGSCVFPPEFSLN